MRLLQSVIAGCVLVLLGAPCGILMAAPPRPAYANVPYGPAPHQILDIYPPPHGHGPFPVLLWFGNLWVAGKFPPPLAPFWNAHCAVIAVEMRSMGQAVRAHVNPPISYCLLDAVRAVQYVRLHAARWRLDPRRIAVAGGSQGSLPALFVGCAGQRANPHATDPVARVSTRVLCVGAWRSQPSIDPKRMRQWVPGVRWGAPALGCSFAQSLRQRQALLPVIKQWSPDWLLHRGDPPIYFQYDYPLDVKQMNQRSLKKYGYMDFLVHNPRWGLGFQKLARQRGVTCYLKFPHHRSAKYRDMWAFLIAHLTRPAERPWLNPRLPAEKRANLLLKAMTLAEKIALLHGGPRPAHRYGGAGYVPADSRLGIPALRMADGRAGVGNGATGVTLLPCPLAAAASWDTRLLYAYGRILGREQWDKGTNVELGPTVDIVRVPEWGRSFETYGEDPYFNGRMAAAEIRGIQSAGPIADANMYLTMNEETDRGALNCVVDERTLQEIYLPPFAAAIRAGVGTVMGAYVQTNGVYSCQNAQLLHDFLRTQLHFRGWVLSDWGAVHSTARSAKAGLDQEMPNGRFFGPALRKAVLQGRVGLPVVDSHVRRILVTMFRHGLFDHRQQDHWQANVGSVAHDRFSRRVAEQGMVLLKDAHHILPLSGVSSIAVIGIPGGTSPMVEGFGSSYVVAPYVVSPLAGIRRRAGAAVKVFYNQGLNPTQAAQAAHAAEVAVVFVSAAQSEGRDRPNLALPAGQDQLVSAVAAANPNTVVVINSGGAVLMPWIHRVRGIIEAWYPGQEDGNAIAAVLFGDVDPGGRLALTFPQTNSQVPISAPQQWPGTKGVCRYSERLDVGYRWYAATRTRPLFPFGFGLSYSTFKLRLLGIAPQKVGSSRVAARVIVAVAVTNSGRRSGSEVVQVYVQDPAANGEPPLQLCGFAKLFLHAGQSQRVKIKLNPRAFSIYDTAAHAWVSPPGHYRIFIGTSSENLPLQGTVTVDASPGAARIP